MYAVTPCRASHAAAIPGHSMTAGQLTALAAHPSATLWRHGIPLACYGCVLASPGRGILWVVIAPQAAQTPVAVVRAMARFLHHAIRDYALHRVEMVVDPTQPKAVRLIRWWGFQYEARLRGYGPGGEDFDSYVWRAKKERVNDR